MSAVPLDREDVDVQTDEERACAGTTRAGALCQSKLILAEAAADGNYYCLNHHPSPVYQQAKRLAVQRGSLISAARKPKVLTDDELGPLDTPEDAMRWSRIIAEATATGRLGAAQANAAMRAVAEWVKARDLEVRETTVANLVKELDALKQRERARLG